MFVARSHTDGPARRAERQPDIPLPGPTPMPMPEVHVQPPLVYVPATWEYHHHACPVAEAGTPGTLATLEKLGREGWELAGIVSDAAQAHFYFKREAR